MVRKLAGKGLIARVQSRQKLIAELCRRVQRRHSGAASGSGSAPMPAVPGRHACRVTDTRPSTTPGAPVGRRQGSITGGSTRVRRADGIGAVMWESNIVGISFF